MVYKSRVREVCSLVGLSAWYMASWDVGSKTTGDDQECSNGREEWIHRLARSKVLQMTATETMLDHPEAHLVLLNEAATLDAGDCLAPPSAGAVILHNYGTSPHGSLAERAVQAGELSWGSQAALAPFLAEESAQGGGKAAAGGEEVMSSALSQLSLQGDSSSDTLGEDEEDAAVLSDHHHHLESPGVVEEGVGWGGEPREVATAGGYAYKLVRANSGVAAVPDKLGRCGGVPNILPNPDLLQQERGRSLVAGYLPVPVPFAITRSFGEDNNSMIDRRAWLEVEDPKHRYAKNLRMYFKEWDRRGQPTSSFWEWLETDPVELEDCPRTQLEIETVQYCDTEAERRQYEVYFQDGRLCRRLTGQPVTTDPDGWIFVLRDNAMYANAKKTDLPPRFHHSSFFAGECIQAAGLFVATNGYITRLYPHSGHYRPTDSHLLTLLLFLEEQGVNLESLAVDVQLVMKVARDQARNGRKRKIDSPYLWTGLHAKHFLTVKRQAWASKLFDSIHVHPLVLRDE